jgi:hypothetical protein
MKDLTRRTFGALIAAGTTLANCLEPKDPWAGRTIARVYTPLMDHGAVFKVDGKEISGVYKAEVFNDGFARLHMYATEGDGGVVFLDPATGTLATNVLECYPEIIPAPPTEGFQPPSDWYAITSAEFTIMDLCREAIEVPNADGWRRNVAGRMFARLPGLGTMVGLAEKEGDGVRVVWLPRDCPEYDDAIAAFAAAGMARR